MKERILADYFKWHQNTHESGVFHTINVVYQWLYDQGILEKEAFLFVREEDDIDFAVDVNRLKPYMDQILALDIPMIIEAVALIFARHCPLCRCTGAFYLNASMLTYRSNGCISKVIEIPQVIHLNNEACDMVRETYLKSGTKEAVKKAFSLFFSEEDDSAQKEKLEQFYAKYEI